MAKIFAPKGFTIAKDDVPVFSAPPYEAQWAQWAGAALAFERVPGGFPRDPEGDVLWDGLEDKRCQCPHFGYLVKGRALMRLPDGTETFINQGDLYYAPPGHRVYALEDFENIEFNPDVKAAEDAMDAFSRNAKKAHD
ncbi:MAG: hypothetical protein WB770_11085 [Acidimicrobiales bacterium]